MAMESVLKQLESRIEDLIEAYRVASDRSSELEAKVVELEGKLAETETRLSDESAAGNRVKALEKQRDELAARLEKVLGLIDGVLASES